MRTIILISMMVFLTNCAYKPVIDTAGRSGTYSEDKAREITNDIQHCDKLAKDNVNQLTDYIAQAGNTYVSWGTLGLIPKRELETHRVTRKCLEGRGHSVVK
jgi:hypothetical protein